MATRFRDEVPPPTFVGTDEEATRLLYTLIKKIELEPEDYIGFDTETHGKKIAKSTGRGDLDWMSDTVTFWSLSTTLNGIWHRWCLQSEHFVYFAPVLENPKATFACFNAKYDAHIAWNCYINIWNANIHDGLVMAHLHDENRQEHGLKSVSRDWLGVQMTSYISMFDTDVHGNKAKEYVTSLLDLPVEPVADYASFDAYSHAQICIWLRDKLKAAPIDMHGYTLWDHFMIMERPVTEILWRMERRGMPLDVDYLKSQIIPINERIKKLEKKIAKEANDPTININSNKQLASLFFGKKAEGGLGLPPIKMTKSGTAPSVDKEVMAALLEAGVEIAEMISEARSLIKTRGTYMEALINLAEHYEDGRLHPSFNQLGAATGRLSTNNPNSQNLPRPDNDEWGIRHAFIAPEEYLMVVADYDQLEMKIMADRSKDRIMIGAILDGKDLHSFTAASVGGESYEAVVEAKRADNPTESQKALKRIRTVMKRVGFGIIYGAGAQTIYETLTEEGFAYTPGEIEDRRTKLQRSTVTVHAPNGHYVEVQALMHAVKKLQRKNPLLDDDKAEELAINISLTQDKIDDYFETFPGVKKYMDRIPEECRGSIDWDFWGNRRNWKFEARNGGIRKLSESGHMQAFGFVQTITGRYRRFPDINHNNFFLRARAERQAVNVTIQGTAADIAKGAMMRVEHNNELNALGAELINQIHDELVILVPRENAEIAAPIIRECMEHPFAVGEDCLKVPLTVDPHIVDRWSRAK